MSLLRNRLLHRLAVVAAFSTAWIFLTAQQCPPSISPNIYGVNEPQTDLTSTQAGAAWGTAAYAGFGWARVPVYWSEIEPHQPANDADRNWTSTDNRIGTLLGKNLSILVVFVAVPC